MLYKIHWWKYLGILLMVYVLIVGLLTTLKPGIFDVKPNRFKTNQKVSINVKGYNTNYTKGNVSTYLKTGNSFLLKAEEVAIINDTELDAVFNLPQHLPGKLNLVQCSFIVDSDYDGTSVLPSKIVLSQDSINEIEGDLSWTISKSPGFHVIHTYRFPYRNILYETIRNTFFHVSLWFAMFSMLMVSVYYAIRYLKTQNRDFDLRSSALVKTAMLFGVLGLATGSLWARNTWDTWWTNDIKLNMSALSMLIYFAYLILRSSIEDPDRRARISGAYNIFALVAVVPLIFVLPRLTDSLHPGNGGNPAFGSDDMDNALRLVFYPAVVGFSIIGFWIAQLQYRLERVRTVLDDHEDK